MAYKVQAFALDRLFTSPAYLLQIQLLLVPSASSIHHDGEQKSRPACDSSKIFRSSDTLFEGSSVVVAVAAATRTYYSSGRFLATSTNTNITEELPPVLPVEVVPPAPVDPRPFERGPLTKLMDRYAMSKQQDRILTAESLFQAATRQSQDPRWYGPARVKREFRPRHAVLTLHVWLLHKRLLADQYDHDNALTIDEEMFNILWDDSLCRIRQTGAMELAVNKHLQKVQQYTFLHLQAGRLERRGHLTGLANQCNRDRGVPTQEFTLALAEIVIDSLGEGAGRRAAGSR